MVVEGLVPITTLYTNNCGVCGIEIKKGDPALWGRGDHKIYHYSCVSTERIKIQRGVTYDNKTDTFTIKVEPNALLHSMLHQIAGIELDEISQLYFLRHPNPLSARQLLDVAELQNFEYSNETLDKLVELINEGIHAILQSSATKSTFKVQGLKHDQYPFQVVGTEFGIANQKVIIGDQMGLGKTIQAMGIIAHMKLYPALIVCPAIIKLNWQRELLSWIEGLSADKIVTLNGRKTSSLPSAWVYIINYDILPYWLKELKKCQPQIVVFDEIHYIKSPAAIRSKAARELTKNVTYVIGLTGTPILNRPEELISPLQILGKLEEMGGRKYFEKRYCDARRDNFNRWNTSGATNLKELNERIRSSGILIRRLKKDVLPDLPAKLPPQIVPIELSNRKEYDAAEYDLAKWLAERAIEDEEFKQSISHLSPLKQLERTSNRRRSVEYLARKNQERTKFIYLKRLSTEGKFHGIKDHVNNFLQSGEKLIVFGWFQDTQKDLSSEWPNCVHALGKDSDKQRNEAIDKFQGDPKCKLLIASLKAIGIGVNLTAASHVAFAELGWNPAEHEQAEDRVHRIGQTEPVNVYYYIGLDTIEEDIIEIIDSKRRMIGIATDGKSSTDKDITSFLIGRILRKYTKKIGD